jgi:acetyl esterase
MDATARMDPEMAAARARMDAEAAKYPPVVPREPLEAQRRINEILTLPWCEGGPAMNSSADRWVAARGRRILCRMHRPVAGETLPLLVWFHGGGWVWQTIDTHDRLVRELAAGSGMAALSIDYSLSPEARFPVAVQEGVAVVHAVAEAAAAWGIDPTRIVLGGDSAGGNLALGVALALRAEGGPALAGLHLAYPVTDTDFESPSYREFAEGYGLTRVAMMAYWDLYLRDPSDRQNPLACPLKADMAGLPPTLIQLAELDVLYSDGERLAQKLQAAGIDASLQAYAGMLHGFLRLTSAVSTARRAVADAAGWLALR